MGGILSSKENRYNTLQPQNFEKHSKLAKIMTIISDRSLDEIGSILGKKIGSPYEAYVELMKLDKGSLSDMADNIMNSYSPLAINTQIKMQHIYSTGNNLIPIYAIHNSHHAVIQHTNLSLVAPIKINGIEYSRFNGIDNSNNEKITSLIAGFLGTSLDNAKENSLSALGQNTITASYTMTLLRMGVPIEIIIPIMRSNVMNSIVDAKMNDNISPLTIINNFTKSIKTIMRMSDYDIYNMGTDISIRSLYNMLAPKEKHAGLGITIDDKIKLLNIIRRVITISGGLNDIINGMKSDTQRGAAGPDIGTMLFKEYKINKINDVVTDDGDKLNNEKTFKISGGAKSLIVTQQDAVNARNFDAIRDLLYNDHNSVGLSYIKAFQLYGINMATSVTEKYLPHNDVTMKMAIKSILRSIPEHKISKDLFRKMVESFVTFKLSDSELFSKADMDNNDIAKTREYFIKAFPSKFIQFIKKRPQLRRNYLFSKLQVQTKGKNVPVTNLQMQGNDIDNSLGDMIMMDWEDLLLSNDMEERMMGVNLLIYSYFRNGLRMGRGSFSQYASSAVRLAIPGYINAMNSITKNSSVLSPQQAERFKDQFIRNTYTFNNLLNNVIISDSNQNISIDNNNYITISLKAINSIKGLTINNNFVEYLTVSINGKGEPSLYKLVDKSKSGYIELHPVNSLGQQGLFTEYDINSDIEESVFKDKEVSDLSKLNKTLSYSEVGADDIVFGEGLKEENPVEKLMDGMEIPELSVDDLPDNLSSLNSDAPNGINMDDISPVEDFTDDSGKESCR